MDISRMIFAVCLSVLLLSQLLTANPIRQNGEEIDEYVTVPEEQLANEMSRALVKLMAVINRHNSKRSRSRRYITFTIGSDYYKRRPRRPHHHRLHPNQNPTSHGGNQLVSQ